MKLSKKSEEQRQLTDTIIKLIGGDLQPEDDVLALSIFISGKITMTKYINECFNHIDGNILQVYDNEYIFNNPAIAEKLLGLKKLLNKKGIKFRFKDYL